MQDDDVAAFSLNAIQHGPEMIKGVVVAYGNQYIRGANAQRRGAQLGTRRDIELVEFRTGGIASLGDSFRNGEGGEESCGKDDAGDGGNLLGEKIDRAQAEQGDGDEHQTYGEFHASDLQIQRNAKFAESGPLIPERQDSGAIHGEAPHHAECVSFAEEEDISAAQDDGGDLQADNEVDDAIGGAKAPMRLPEPLRENPVFRNAVEHAIRPDNGGVYGSGKHQHADQHYECLKDQAQGVGPREIHRQTADQVSKILRTG